MHSMRLRSAYVVLAVSLWAMPVVSEAVTGKLAVIGFGTSTQAQMLADATMIAEVYRTNTWGDWDFTPVGIGPLAPITQGCDPVRGTGLIFEQAAAIMRAAGHEPLDYLRIVLVIPSTTCNFAGWGMAYGRWAISVNRCCLLHEIGHTLSLWHDRIAYSPMHSAKTITSHTMARLNWFAETGAFFRVTGANFPLINFPKWAYPEEPCYWDHGCTWHPSWLKRVGVGEVVALTPVDVPDSLVAGAQLPVHILASGEPDYYLYADYLVRNVAFPRVIIYSAGAPNQMTGPTDPLAPVSGAGGERAMPMSLGALTTGALTVDLCARGLRARLISMDATEARVVFESYVCPPLPPPPPPPACIPRGHSGKCR